MLLEAAGWACERHTDLSSLRNLQSHNGHWEGLVWDDIQTDATCHTWKRVGLSYPERVLWEHKDKETSKPKLSIWSQSIGSRTSPVQSERKLKLSLCKDRSEDLYLNGKQRPGKGKEINLMYASSTYTNPFLLVSFSLLFSTRWRKHVGRMAADWADPAPHRAEDGSGSLPRRWGVGRGRGASSSMTRVGVFSSPGLALPGENSLEVTITYISTRPKATPARVVRYSNNLFRREVFRVRHDFLKPPLWVHNQIIISCKFISFDSHRDKV